MAPGVLVADLLPAGLAFVSAQADAGRLQRRRRPVDRGDAGRGGSAQLVLTVRVTAVGTFRNTAAVTFPGTDPNLANNVAAVAIQGFIPVPSKRFLLGSAFGM